MKILFVCLGNICRSPMAEGIFLHLAKQAGVVEKFVVDSAGTDSYHEGQSPDRRGAQVARARGIHLTGCSRQVEDGDFTSFDMIIAMDRSNESSLRNRCPANFQDKISMLRVYEDAESPPDVPDPYYGGPNGFEDMYDIIHHNCAKLLAELMA